MESWSWNFDRRRLDASEVRGQASTSPSRDGVSDRRVRLNQDRRSRGHVGLDVALRQRARVVPADEEVGGNAGPQRRGGGERRDDPEDRRAVAETLDASVDTPIAANSAMNGSTGFRYRLAGAVFEMNSRNGSGNASSSSARARHDRQHPDARRSMASTAIGTPAASRPQHLGVARAPARTRPSRPRGR